MSIVTKANIASELAQRTNTNKTEAANILNSVLDIIAENLKTNDSFVVFVEWRPHQRQTMISFLLIVHCFLFCNVTDAIHGVTPD